MLEPRYYQTEAFDASLKWMKSNSDPCLIIKAMGAGKSVTIAMIANALHKLSGGKRVLCLCPSKELTQQNYKKFIAIGGQASIYSASISKSMRHAVVFATEQSFVKIAENFRDQFCAIIPDEAHKITDTFLEIYRILKDGNPNLRVCGLTATAYQNSKGYIYEMDENNVIVQDAIDPFYKKVVYRKEANELIDEGYLTPPLIGAVNSHYETSGLTLKNGKFDEKQLASLFENQSVTAKICQDILIKTQDRKRCLLFATSIKHAEEIQGLVPNCGLVSGKTPKTEREAILKQFADGDIKYLVNVAILTTGYDLPILDAIAILRPTESAGLYQQIIGRGTRLADDKENFLILDYTDNIPQFFDGKDSVFEPNIKAYGSKPSVQIEVACPECGTKQEHAKRNGYETWDEFGYVTDLTGDLVEPLIPSHYGRRCTGVVLKGRNQYERCSYFWAHKTCPCCQEKNDIAAKNCSSCGYMLINPEQKLNEQAYIMQVGDTLTTNVHKMEVENKGKIAIVKFYTAHQNIMCKMYPNHENHFISLTWRKFNKATQGGTVMPTRLTYTLKKDKTCSIQEYHFD